MAYLELKVPSPEIAYAGNAISFPPGFLGNTLKGKSTAAEVWKPRGRVMKWT